MFRAVWMPVMGAILLSGCAATPKDEETPAPRDYRIGEEVRQLCFVSSISSWSSIKEERNAVLVHMDNRKVYRLQLIGACRADWAMMSIGFVSRTSSNCLSRGDKLITDAQRVGNESCTIVRINEWNPQAGEAPESAGEL